MLVFENHCVDCTDLGLPCLGDRCSNRNVEVTLCDKCGKKIEQAILGEDIYIDCFAQSMVKDKERLNQIFAELEIDTVDEDLEVLTYRYVDEIIESLERELFVKFNS